MSDSPPSADLAARLRRRRILYVCHMTPCDRLPSIFASGGLLSLAARRERDVAGPSRPHDWGEGKREALARYAVCAFETPKWMCNKHPEEMALVLLDARLVCCGEGVLFCPGNSADEKYPVDDILGMTGAEHFDACFRELDNNAVKFSEILVPGQIPVDYFRLQPRPVLPQQLVLVPGQIPVDYFRGLVFCDQQARDYWMTEIEEHLPDPSLTVTSRVLWDFGFPVDWHPAERVRP